MTRKSHAKTRQHKTRHHAHRTAAGSRTATPARIARKTRRSRRPAAAHARRPAAGPKWRRTGKSAAVGVTETTSIAALDLDQLGDALSYIRYSLHSTSARVNHTLALAVQAINSSIGPLKRQAEGGNQRAIELYEDIILALTQAAQKGKTLAHDLLDKLGIKVEKESLEEVGFY